MAEIPERENLPEAVVAPPKRGRISMIWIVPLFAAVVAIGTLLSGNYIGLERGKSDKPQRSFG